MARMAISGVLNLLCNRGGISVNSQLIWNLQNRASHWQSSLLGLRAAVPMRMEPKRKKKIDPRREHAIKERLKKKIKRLEKAGQEFIPLEDFITPLKFMDNTRVRDAPPLPTEESERRAILLKKWSSYKQKQHTAEMDAIRSLVATQEKALQELRLESEKLYQAAIRRDDSLFPFESKEPTYTPPLSGYDAPNGKCIDVTPQYTQ